MRHFLLCTLALLASAPAVLAAESLRSSYSDLSQKACIRDTAVSPNGPGEHQPVAYRCRGPAGMTVSVRYEGTHVRVRFSGAGLSAENPALRAAYAIGERMEWRGTGQGAAFVPQAGILRMRRREGAAKFGDVLAILRKDGDRICLAAVVDATNVPDANLFARKTADALSASFRCATGRAQVAGPATERATEALDDNR